MSIWITPQSQLIETLELSSASHLIVLVSDGSTVSRPARIAPNAFMLLVFNDITEPKSGLTMPDKSHVAALLQFHNAIPNGAVLTICCYAGISRSTAAAFILGCRARPDLTPQDLAQRLRASASSATPNSRLVALADNLMGAKGEMSAAIASIGRGADAFAGTPFQLSC